MTGPRHGDRRAGPGTVRGVRPSEGAAACDLPPVTRRSGHPTADRRGRPAGRSQVGRTAVRVRRRLGALVPGAGDEGGVSGVESACRFRSCCPPSTAPWSGPTAMPPGSRTGDGCGGRRRRVVGRCPDRGRSGRAARSRGFGPRCRWRGITCRCRRHGGVRVGVRGRVRRSRGGLGSSTTGSSTSRTGSSGSRTGVSSRRTGSVPATTESGSGDAGPSSSASTRGGRARTGGSDRRTGASRPRTRSAAWEAASSRSAARSSPTAAGGFSPAWATSVTATS